MKSIFLTLTLLSATSWAITPAEQKMNERIQKAKDQFALDIAKQKLKDKHKRERDELKAKQAREKAELQLQILNK